MNRAFGRRKSRARAALALFAALMAAGCGETPQLGGDEASFTAVDALWTAISAKSGDLLDQSLSEVRRLNQAGQLPDEALQSLEEIAGTARAGDWATARSELKRFIKGQRRTE